MTINVKTSDDKLMIMPNMADDILVDLGGIIDETIDEY